MYKGFSFLILDHQNFRGAYLSHFSSILNDLKCCGCASRPLYFAFWPCKERRWTEWERGDWYTKCSITEPRLATRENTQQMHLGHHFCQDRPDQCWVVLRMGENYALVINPGIYPLTCQFSKYSKNRFWHVTFALRKWKSQRTSQRPVSAFSKISWNPLVLKVLEITGT